MRASEFNTPIPAVVHGSFRRHFDEIGEAIQTLESTGFVSVIAPHSCDPIGEQDGFILLEGEQGKDPREVEFDFTQKVASLRALGGFSIWVNPDGYVGKSAAYEYGDAKRAGIRSFFTHQPEDVPFHVNPYDIMSPAQLAANITRHQVLPPFQPDRSEIGQRWENRPTATAQVAVGGVVQFRHHLLLVEDGRWKGQLTVPGTTVRGYETNANQALDRLFDHKFGLQVSDVTDLRTSFMLPGEQPADTKVFDDRHITLASPTTRPESGLAAHMFTASEVQDLIMAGQVEPNASALLKSFLAA